MVNYFILIKLGECDKNHHTCDCDDGYGDDGCGTKYEEYEYPAILSIIFICFSCFITACIVGCIYWLRSNIHHRVIFMFLL